VRLTSFLLLTACAVPIILVNLAGVIRYCATRLRTLMIPIAGELLGAIVLVAWPAPGVSPEVRYEFRSEPGAPCRGADAVVTRSETAKHDVAAEAP